MALGHLQRGNVAPVDLAQAAIGPAMAVYTRYATVVDAEGKPLTVREALALINQTLDEALAMICAAGLATMSEMLDREGPWTYDLLGSLSRSS